jgi:hypothetical protein
LDGMRTFDPQQRYDSVSFVHSADWYSYAL